MSLAKKWKRALQPLKTRVVVVLAGQLDVDLTEYISSTDLVIAVDGGLDHLDRFNYIPDVLIGDLDSVSVRDYQGPRIVFDPVKDETDFVCALNYANEIFSDLEIVVFGFSSITRLDHVLANLSVLKPGMTLISDNHQIQLITTDLVVLADSYKYYSFFAIEPVSTFSLKGFKYQLENYQLKPFDPLCVSNELIANSGKIELSNGRVILIKSKIN